MYGPYQPEVLSQPRGTATDNTVTVSWTGSGAQTVSVSYTNGNGCTAATPTVLQCKRGALPVPTITGDNAVCEDSDYYTYTTEPGMTNYVWAMSPGSGTMTWVTGSNEVMIFWTTSGAKFVSVSYTNASGCSASAPTVFNVTVSPVPSAAGTITGTTTLCQGTSGVTYTTTAISGAASYSWTVPRSNHCNRSYNHQHNGGLWQYSSIRACNSSRQQCLRTGHSLFPVSNC
ncbi:MAG: hypothetical protein IPH45_13475 [Bacteroidales bacterium]|nr:hypothetical protein [Bacteroidales bacterium]